MRTRRSVSMWAKNTVPMRFQGFTLFLIISMWRRWRNSTHSWSPRSLLIEGITRSWLTKKINWNSSLFNCLVLKELNFHSLRTKKKCSIRSFSLRRFSGLWKITLLCWIPSRTRPSTCPRNWTYKRVTLKYLLIFPLMIFNKNYEFILNSLKRFKKIIKIYKIFNFILYE